MVQIMDAVRGRAAFNVADFNKAGERVHLEISELQRLLLVICAVCVCALANDALLTAKCDGV